MTIVHDIYDFTDEINEGIYRNKILIEGDSWVSHPMPWVRNLANQFHDDAPDDNLILTLASPGDEASAIFRPHGRQMKLLKKLLGSNRWGDKFDLIFLSAAGNDIVGPEIVSRLYVKNKRDFPALYGRELMTDNYYQQVSEVVAGYARLLKFLGNSMNRDTPVITHTYSYLRPRRVGTHLGPFKFNKGWVQRHLIHQGITELEEQMEIVREMMDAFYRRVVKLQDQFPTFRVVDTRQVLSRDGEPDMRYWHDEIHPNSQGFRKLFKAIARDARAQGFGTTD